VFISKFLELVYRLSNPLDGRRDSWQGVSSIPCSLLENGGESPELAKVNTEQGATQAVFLDF